MQPASRGRFSCDISTDGPSSKRLGRTLRRLSPRYDRAQDRRRTSVESKVGGRYIPVVVVGLSQLSHRGLSIGSVNAPLPSDGVEGLRRYAAHFLPYAFFRKTDGGNLVGGLLGALDQVLPWRELLWLALAAKLFSPVLKMRDVRLAPLVGDCVITAPLGRDPPEVAAGVLSLGIVTHVDDSARTMKIGNGVECKSDRPTRNAVRSGRTSG